MSIPGYWQIYIDYSRSRAEKQKIDTEEALREALSMVETFRNQGYIPMTPSRILSLDDIIISSFYNEIGNDRFTAGGMPSPVENLKDSSWMIESDFCFLNIRATSLQQKKTGKITDAMKLLPALRVSSIHLAPFFDCTMHNLYAVDSLRIITEDIINPGLLKAGVAPHEQMLLLIDAIHMLGKTVGFDLEPHTSQFSRVVLENPHHFRWLHLNEERTDLFEGLSIEEMFGKNYQQKIVRKMNGIIDRVLKEFCLISVEDLEQGVERVRHAHQKIIETLIKEGLWTLPSHTWNGVGLPKFESYNFKDNYPNFTYLDAEGEDQQAQSFGMLTPFSIYTKLPFNKAPEAGAPPEYKYDTMGFLVGIFPKILNTYRFDFVRIDYVDHVFDSTVDESWDIPISDRMTPKVLKAIIEEARSGRPYIGAMAERMGPDIWDYRSVGFDLVLGQDVLTTMHKDYLIYCLENHDKIRLLAQEWENPASVLFAVDTHDSGHPLFWTTPLSEVVGPQGLRLRHFLSRFLFSGKLRKPKYEVMGNQDLSYGLYDANNKPQSLTWKDDEEYNRRYHMLEDIYEELKPQVLNATLGPLYCERDFMFWFLDARNERILCFAALEREVKKLKVLLEEKYEYSSFANIEIDFYQNSTVEDPVIFEIDLESGEKREIFPSESGRIVLSEIEPLGVRLFIIKERDAKQETH